VLAALRLYLALHRPDAMPSELLFVDPSGRRPAGDNLASALRRDLKKAGVARAQLYTNTSERKHLRGHDLRATFVTVNLASGKTETWIADRTGHKSSQMIAKYRRLARTHAELNLGELVPLADAIPEFANISAENGTTRARSSPAAEDGHAANPQGVDSFAHVQDPKDLN